MKEWFRSKTIGFFLAVGVVSGAFAAENLFNTNLGTGIEVEPETAFAGVIMALIGVGLRFVTNTAVKV